VPACLDTHDTIICATACIYCQSLQLAYCASPIAIAADW